MVRFLTSVLLLSSCAVAFATDWYVRPSTGEYGAEDGTSYATAFDGFADHNAACASIADGDTVKIDGTYLGEQLIPCPGSAAGHVTYTYYDSANPPVLDGNGTATAVILSNNLDYWKLVGPLTAQNVAGPAINIFGGSSDIVIDNVTCTDTAPVTSGCIRGRDMVNFEVKNSLLTNNDGNGLAADIGGGAGGGRNISFHDNIAYGNTYRGISVTGAISTGDIYYDVAVYNNETYTNGDGIYLAAVDGFEVYNNVSYDNEETTYAPAEQYGIAFQQCRNGKIYLNTTYGNHSDGVEVWGDANGPAKNVWAFANIFYAHVTGLITSSTGNGLEYATQYSPGARIFGNVFIGNNHAFRFSKDSTNTSLFYNNTLVDNTYGLTLADSGGFALSGWTFSNNIISGGEWIKGARNDNTLVFSSNNYYNGTASYNQVAYTTANITSLDALAKILDPDFVGATPLDKYSWQHQESGLYDTGVNIPYIMDAFANSCLGAQDFGAYCNGMRIPYGYTLKPKRRR